MEAAIDNRRRGFTLVEVIVVLVILAILAAIMIPAMTGWIDKAKERRLIVECRTCVTAAQTIASEKYGTLGAGNVAVSPDETLALAEVSGAVSGIAIDEGSTAVDTLTYDDGTDSVTYYRQPAPHYEFNKGGAVTPGWTSGTQYAVGARISGGNLIFECTRAHTSGTTGTTRSPEEKSNKSTWKVIGTKAGAETQSYSSIYRYAEGVTVTYNGKTYKRTNYNPTADQTPSATSLYWDVVD